MPRSQLFDELRREKLIGLKAAAALLGIPASNFKRDAAPHLLVVPVEGSAAVYFRSDVLELARERERKAAAKAKRNGDAD